MNDVDMLEFEIEILYKFGMVKLNTNILSWIGGSRYILVNSKFDRMIETY